MGLERRVSTNPHSIGHWSSVEGVCSTSRKQLHPGASFFQILEHLFGFGGVVDVKTLRAIMLGFITSNHFN